MSNRRQLPSANSPNFLTRVREVLQTYLGASGDPLDQGVTLRDLILSGIAKIRTGVTVGGGGGGSGGVVIIEPGGEEDLTPPPQPTGFSATPGLTNIFVQCDQPLYTQGNGHLRSRLYGAIYTGGAQPTFADAAELLSFEGIFFALPSNINTEWRLWLKWETRDGVLSTDPAGGTNGVVAKTGVVGNSDLGDLIITAGKIAAGNFPGMNLVPNPGAEDGTESWGWTQGVTDATFATDTSDKVSGSRSFKITKVSAANSVGYGCRAMPVIPNETYAVRVKVRTNVAAGAGLSIRIASKATYPVGDIVTLALRETLSTLAVNIASTSTWSEYKYTWTVPAGMYWATFEIYWQSSGTATQLWFDDVSVGRQVTAEMVQAGAIVAGKLAANAIIAGDGVIGNLAVDNSQIANLSAAKITAGQIQAGSYIRSTSYTPGSVGWTINADGTAEFGFASIRGTLAANQVAANSITSTMIDSRNLTIKDAADNVIFGAAEGLNVNLLRGGQAYTFNWDDQLVGDWVSDGGSGELSVATTTAAGAAGKWLLSAGNNSGNDMVRLVHGQNIPFNPNALYRIRVIARKTAGTGTAYFGVSGVASDGTTFVNTTGADQKTSSQHWVVANNVSLSSAWTEYVGYFKGTSATGTGTACPDASSPGVLHTNVRFIRPAIILNYNSVAGTSAVNLIQIETVSGPLGTIDQITRANVSTWIESAAIGSAQIDNLAVGTAQMGNLAVTTAKINDLAVTTAKVNDLAVTTAKINDLAVSTLKIADQAVTIPVSAYTSGSTSGVAPLTVQSAAITSTGAPIAIFAGLQIDADNTTDPVTFTFELQRDGLAVASLDVSAVSGCDTTVAFPPIRNTPGAGTFTYSIVKTVGTPTRLMRRRGLVLMETKK